MNVTSLKTRKFTKIIATSSLSVLLSLTATSAFAFKQQDKIIAGSDVTFFPYEYMKDNVPAGFDIEFLDGLAKVMGKTAVTVDTRWANLIPGLRGNRFDITNSSMYITKDRMKVIDMIPYLKSGESILSIKGSAYQPKVPEDFCGHKIGSMAGTSWLQQIQKLSKEHCVANGLKPISISEYPTDPQTTQAMLSGAVEAQITDAAVARGVVQKLGNRVVISSDSLLYPVLNGFGVKKGNDEVRTALENGLAKFKQTPEYAALLKKYNFQAPTQKDIDTLMPH
ncbi:ABC transporter substrate-binding protein [Vibrio nitrifigilis]|uniref:ABC transporter substrate-binding protein n=1 Tax=Vibrio nitrifigilis TaxID=2789781 RepID=A0ABS0GIR1_9VIBR|nr:ABC transporter substrate-binding protein [Vibrio nitrifigilis]MBF9002327.1 ABC transporter substrate-binding protein [Vibrio nitrifigilis]